MNFKQPRWIALAVVLLLIAGLFYAGFSGLASGVFKPPYDKVAHLGFWGGVSGLVYFATYRSNHSRWVPFLMLMVIATIEEGSQHWQPGRTVEFADLVMNYFGIALGGFIVPKIIRQLNR
jgi:VanZ family protein